jgi:hypothetical protein|tara:strand:- start:413 stop:598 length:186 start_codon:yes stop_codon:yes gene_type:complete
MKLTENQIKKLRKVLIDKISKSPLMQESCCLEGEMVDFVSKVNSKQLIEWAIKHKLNLKDL